MWLPNVSLLSALPLSSTLTAVSVNVARWIVLRQLEELQHGKLIIHEADGTKYVFGALETPVVELHIHANVSWVRLLFAHDVGFAEAYMLGELSCPDLSAFFRFFIRNAPSTGTNVTGGPSAAVALLAGAITGSLHHLANTNAQALVNARSHYSLGNGIFAAFLDPTMTYSAPLWLSTLDPRAATDNLESAQRRKLQYAINSACIVATDHVLEIGTGWGSFTIEAVRVTGCRVTTVTASEEQAVLARERIRAAGAEKHVRVLVCDYREIPLPCEGDIVGRYDKVVSIEMVEHVGASYLDTYFGCIDRYLKLDGGIAVVQGITLPEARAAGYARRSDFIQRYIFPGGHLPTVSSLVASIGRGSKGRMVVDDITSLGGHYVRALREWRENFLGNWTSQLKPALAKSHPGMRDIDMDVFRRKWEYYFSYCEAGFATKTLGDVCITAGREGSVQLIQNTPS